jgi:hypothetical protein
MVGPAPLDQPDRTAELVARAKERAAAKPVDESWGYRIDLDVGESFAGRYRGEAADAQNGGRRVFLFWDRDDQLCWSRTYAALEREIDQAAPAVGATIVLVRGEDYASGKGNPGRSFGVATEPHDGRLPGEGRDDIPF